MNPKGKTTPNATDEHSLDEVESAAARPDADPSAASSPAADHTAGETDTEASESGDPQTELFRRIDAIQAEKADMEGRYLRAVADLENFRKRALRDRDEVRIGAISSMAEDLFPILDNMALGLRSAAQHESAEAIRKGFEMVLQQFEGLLERHGIRKIVPDDQRFDPNLHDCVSHQPSQSVEEGMVIETVRSGYQLRDRLIRPASVVVSSGPAAAETPEPEEDTEDTSSGT